MQASPVSNRHMGLARADRAVQDKFLRSRMKFAALEFFFEKVGWKLHPAVVITGKGLVDGETGPLFQTATLVGLSGGNFLFVMWSRNSFCFGVPSVWQISFTRQSGNSQANWAISSFNVGLVCSSPNRTLLLEKGSSPETASDGPASGFVSSPELQSVQARTLASQALSRSPRMLRSMAPIAVSIPYRSVRSRWWSRFCVGRGCPDDPDTFRISVVCSRSPLLPCAPGLSTSVLSVVA